MIQQFTATGTYSDNSAKNLTASVTWTSSNLTVATISNTAGSNGLATPIAAGTTTIMAALGNVSASATLAVTTTLESITVTPVNASIAAGTKQQFTATGTFSDGPQTDITTSVIWTSSNGSVATIDAAGKAAALAAGTTTITAMSGSISNSASLQVTLATLVSIAVTPVNPSVFTGATEQFTATGSFSDGSQQDVTDSVIWSSSTPAVATISNKEGSNGLAATIAVGETIITAASGNISNSTAMTVNSAIKNVLPITVNGPLCSANSYPNKPCVSVTICTPGTSTCQTIYDILLDTGSIGLRVFKSVLGPGISLTQVTNGADSLAECIQYMDGSAQWGPVQRAGVVLGNEPAVLVPIQVIDPTFGTVPLSCVTQDQNPAAAGYNGILGLGLFIEDCGAFCATHSINQTYYSCSGSTCIGTSVPLLNQVQNPVALLPRDNNGVTLQLPAISSNGTSSVNGILVLGIGTQANNTPSGVTTYPTDQSGDFVTVYNNVSYNQSFIDSGSNGLFFPGSLPQCFGWFCPSSATNLSAVNKGVTGSPSATVSFQIGNFNTLVLHTSNNVFNNIGAYSAGGFDWGLPFFFGKNVTIGIEGKPSILGTGPYWAY